LKINQFTNPNIIGSFTTVASTPPGSGNAVNNDTSEASVDRSFSKVMKEALVLKETQVVKETRSPEEAAHIAEITAAVRQGTYRIDSDKIADKILESVLRNTK